MLLVRMVVVWVLDKEMDLEVLELELDEVVMEMPRYQVREGPICQKLFDNY